MPYLQLCEPVHILNMKPRNVCIIFVNGLVFALVGNGGCQTQGVPISQLWMTSSLYGEWPLVMDCMRESSQWQITRVRFLLWHICIYWFNYIKNDGVCAGVTNRYQVYRVNKYTTVVTHIVYYIVFVLSNYFQSLSGMHHLLYKHECASGDKTILLSW